VNAFPPAKLVVASFGVLLSMLNFITVIVLAFHLINDTKLRDYYAIQLRSKKIIQKKFTDISFAAKNE
jgi:hypothetical protein